MHFWFQFCGVTCYVWSNLKWKLAIKNPGISEPNCSWQSYTVHLHWWHYTVFFQLSDSDLGKNTFKDLKSLMQLNLAHNALKKMPAGVPSGLIQLFLDKNRIDDIPKQVHRARHHSHQQIQNFPGVWNVTLYVISFLETSLRASLTWRSWDSTTTSSVTKEFPKRCSTSPRCWTYSWPTTSCPQSRSSAATWSTCTWTTTA